MRTMSQQWRDTNQAKNPNLVHVRISARKDYDIVRGLNRDRRGERVAQHRARRGRLERRTVLPKGM